MKRWLRALLRKALGATGPTAPIVKHRPRLALEPLEDRLALSGPQTFLVTTNLDDNVAHPGKLSLRQAIDMANTDGDPTVVDVIKFDPSLTGKTITLVQGELEVFESVNIQGLGAAKLTIDGGAVAGNPFVGSRIFNLFGGEASPDHVTISGLTLQNGIGPSSIDPEIDGGGAIGTIDFGLNFPGVAPQDSLTVRGCVLKNNITDGTGGAISVTGGHLTVQDCTITGNTSGNEGGGIAFDDFGNGTHLQMDRDTVANNTSLGEQGGGLSIQGGTATVNACTFYGNTAGAEGGAIASRPTGTEPTASFSFTIPINPAKTVIENTTIYGNTSYDDGGGGVWNGGSLLTLLNDTIDQNRALGTGNFGGGVLTSTFDLPVPPFTTFSATTNILNSIVAGNVDGTGRFDLFSENGTTTNAAYSLIQHPNGAVNGTRSHDIFGVDPGLQPLANNGGPTLTQLLAPNSPALKAGSTALLNGLPTDQIGNPRTFQGFVDMGAVEVSFLLPPKIIQFRF
jgi:hypothetical protein